MLNNCNILVIGSKLDGSLELAYCSAFASIGICSVTHFDPEENFRKYIKNRVFQRLWKRAYWALVGKSLCDYLRENNRFDIIFVCKGGQLTPTTIAYGKKLCPNSVWVNINPDDPLSTPTSGPINRNVVNSIPLFDVYVIWNRSLIKAIRASGCHKVIYLPFGYNPDWHYPSKILDERLKQTITFVGCWDRNREKILTSLADFPLSIYGNFWDRIKPYSPLRGSIHPYNIYGDQLRTVISSSRASLNILRPQNYGSHNMRTFEIPAMKGLMIATRSEEQEEFFPEGRASLMYYDVDELRKKVKFVMEEGERIEFMREAAYSLRIGHSYADRAKCLLDEVWS